MNKIFQESINQGNQKLNRLEKPLDRKKTQEGFR
jgi:hypothetical protein